MWQRILVALGKCPDCGSWNTSMFGSCFVCLFRDGMAREFPKPKPELDPAAQDMVNQYIADQS